MATALSKAVNHRIFVEAKKIANKTDEVQNPPQIYPQHVEHLCAACNGGERGQTTVHVGTAIAVMPTARWDEFRAGGPRVAFRRSYWLGGHRLVTRGARRCKGQPGNYPLLARKWCAG